MLNGVVNPTTKFFRHLDLGGHGLHSWCWLRGRSSPRSVGTDRELLFMMIKLNFSIDIQLWNIFHFRAQRCPSSDFCWFFCIVAKIFSDFSYHGCIKHQYTKHDDSLKSVYTIKEEWSFNYGSIGWNRRAINSTLVVRKHVVEKEQNHFCNPCYAKNKKHFCDGLCSIMCLVLKCSNNTFFVYRRFYQQFIWCIT